MTRILGIDPGAVSGGCAIVEINNGAAPQPLPYLKPDEAPCRGIA